MYKVTVRSDGITYPLYLPGAEELILQDPVLTLEMGKAGSFTFTVLPNHPYADKIKPLSSELYVYEAEKEIFRGRFIGREEDFYKLGKVTCEGDLAYLLDSLQRPYTHEGSIIDYLKSILSVHNAQVEKRKQFELGRVTVADRSSISDRSSEDYKNTLDCLNGKLVKVHGGFLRTRLEGEKRYLDYVTDYGGINEQIIRFGENMVDLNQHLDPSAIITALIPLGAEIEKPGANQDEKTQKLTIASVNGGKDYIYDEKAVAQYGWILKMQEFQEETEPGSLMNKAKAYLQECLSPTKVLEMQAVDFSTADSEIPPFQVGYWTKVESPEHFTTQTCLLSKKVIHLTAPEQDTIILGGTLTTMTESSADNKKDLTQKVDQIKNSTSKEINSKIENATQLITGGLGGYVILDHTDPDTGKKIHPWRILIMNAPDKSKAKNVIQINQNGIGFSTSGIKGPYRNAWTIDGNLVADFITAGSMLADRIRGGMLEIGGASLGKTGSIVVKDAAGTVLAVMNQNGMDIKKGSIIGSKLVLGGRDNINGSLTVHAANGTIACKMDGAGLYAVQGTVGGWTIGDSYLETGTGLIRSNEGANTANRATMNNASFKIWINNQEHCYLGRGGYNGWGSSDSGLLYIGGRASIELDGNSGKINAGGDIKAQGKVVTHGGINVEGNASLNCTGTAYFTGSQGVQVSRDLVCGGDVHGKNISAMSGEINAIKQRLGM